MAKRQDLVGEETPIIGDACVIRTTLDVFGDISGWSFAFLLKANRRQADAEAVVTEATDGVTQAIFDAGGVDSYGVVDTTLLEAVTETLAHGTTYWYAVQRDDAGVKTTLVHGEFPALRP